MRIILSRKGFDSANGGRASPILPGGRLLSLPIPSSLGTYCYAEIRGLEGKLGPLVHDLTEGRYGDLSPAHLDPDLRATSVDRLPGWRQSFGQLSNAQSHLAKQQVGAGDLFLFFGWFREVERVSGAWRFRRGAPDRHVLYGWLQVAEVVTINGRPGPAVARLPWLAGHPHLASAVSPNVIYLARERLSLEGMTHDLPGGGVFPQIANELILSRNGQRLRSRWLLPRWFYPTSGRRPLTFHEELDRWKLEPEGAALHTQGRGQEFVLQCADYPESVPWAAQLISAHGGLAPLGVGAPRPTASTGALDL